MSVKVLTGKEAAAAQAVRWPSAGGSIPETPAKAELFSSLEIEAPRSTQEIEHLKSELARARSENEQRVQEAVASARREGENAARETLAAGLNVEVERLKQLGKEMFAASSGLRKQAEGDLVRLAIAIARRILHREIAVDSEALLGLTKAALARIDQREIHVIRTHPDSVALLQRIFEQDKNQRRIEISADARLERGALIIETARGELDASVETLLDEIGRGFTDLVGNES